MTHESAKQVTLKVQRYDPEQGSALQFKEYTVPSSRGTTVLDGLIYIKENLDSTLAFRTSCRMAICGSCGVLVASLQSLLAWLLLIGAAILARPQLGLRAVASAAVVVTLLLLTPHILGRSPVHLLLAVTAMMGLMAAGQSGTNRRVLLLSGLAALSLTLFRFAQLQVPLVWLASQWAMSRLLVTTVTLARRASALAVARVSRPGPR